MSVIDDMTSLQEQDSLLEALKRQIRDLPSRRAVLEAPISDGETRISSGLNNIERFEKRAGEWEAEAETIRSNINHLKQQQQTLRTTKEIATMERQINGAKRALDEKEEQILKGRHWIEEIKEQIAKTQEEMLLEKARIQDAVDEIETRLSQVKGKLAAAEAVREERRKVLDTDEARKFLNYYERLGRKCQPVIVRLDPKGSPCCAGCHMVLPAAKIQEARRNATVTDAKDLKIVACDSCGRLLFP